METGLATIQQLPSPMNIREKIETIRQTVAKDANDAQLEMFLTLAERYQLDPFLREIWFSKDIGIITGRDGYLKVAHRDPNFDGIVSAAVCDGDVFKLNPVVPEVHHEFGSKRGAVIGAYAVVFHKRRRPVVAYAPFAEYQKASTIWQKYRSAMICKVAEALALKRQFGISGLVTEEEVGSGTIPNIPAADTTPLNALSPSDGLIDPPQPQTTSDVPSEVQEDYRTMASQKAQGFAHVFGKYLNYLKELQGHVAGLETYNMILGHHQVDTWQSFKSMKAAKHCVLALHEKVHELRSDGEPVTADLFAEEVTA